MHPSEPPQYPIPPDGYGWTSAPVPNGAPAVPPPGYPVPGYPPAGHVPPGHPPYGAAQYGAGPYWTAPAWTAPPAAAAWPHGPGRPGLATAAAVLGFVTGGLTALGSLGFLISVLVGDGDLPSGLLILGLPCAAGLIRGAVLVLRRDAATTLIGSCIAAVAVLLVALVTGVADFSGDDLAGLVVFVLVALALPVVTASLAATGTVRGWLSSRG